MPLFYKPPHDTLSEKISKLTDLVSTLANAISTQGVKHDNLVTSHQLLDERVTKNEKKLEDMQTTTNSITTVSRIIQLTGVGIVAGAFALWSAQSTKLDNTVAKTENNIQSIEQLRKESDEQERKIDDNKAKIIANREAILSEAKDLKSKGVSDE